MQTDGGLFSYLFRRLRDCIIRKAVLLKTTVAISSLRMLGTAEVHTSVAGIAVIEVPISRACNLDNELFAICRFRFLDGESTCYWLAAYRTNFVRRVFHGVA